MEKNKNVDAKAPDLFEKHSEEITPAYQKAVREALFRHKQAGVPIAVSVKGKVTIVKPA